MNHYWHRFEWFVDVSIPYILIILSVLLLADFVVDLHKYQLLISVFDGIVVAFFVLDLFFKWNHVRNVPLFVRLYWIDLLAVFPFYLAFRMYAFLSGILIAGEEIVAGQRLMHEAALLREAEVLAKEGRLARGIEFFQRLIRTIAARLELTRHSMHERSAQLRQGKV